MKEIKSFSKSFNEIKNAIRQFKKPVQPTVEPTPSGVKQRDMRQEAMDLGSHGAKEYFGGTNEPTN